MTEEITDDLKFKLENLAIAFCKIKEQCSTPRFEARQFELVYSLAETVLHLAHEFEQHLEEVEEDKVEPKNNQHFVWNDAKSKLPEKHGIFLCITRSASYPECNPSYEIRNFYPKRKKAKWGMKDRYDRVEYWMEIPQSPHKCKDKELSLVERYNNMREDD